MNLRRRVYASAVAFLVPAVLFLSGCNPISVGDSVTNGHSRSAEFSIKQAVLKDLFDFQDVRMHPIRPGISAYIIDDPADGKRLAAEFAGHVPPVASTATIINDQSEDLDKATGKPVEVYAVRIRELSCDHARVGAGWRSAPLVGIWYTYELQLVNGVWTVKSKAVVGIS